MGMLEMLFRPIFPCDPDDPEAGILCILVPDLSESECPDNGFVTCEKYWNSEADYMRKNSFILSAYWILVAAICVVGHMILFWGFGNASERMSKRVRDTAFKSLVRQEVSFFDKRNVGKITSELQEDATKIQVFTGDPVRQIVMALAGIVAGLAIAFVYMWPFAILALSCVPIMGYASSLEMKQMMGTDMEEDNEKEEQVSTPGGIIVETLLNIGTVSALTLEEERYRTFEDVVRDTEEDYITHGLRQGVVSGLSICLQEWVMALQIWFGGWLLYKYPEDYTFYDLMVSMFGLLFGIFTLGAAFQDMADRKETEESASRIFYLIDHRSAIDPFSEDGKTVDYNALPKPRSKKKSMERKKSIKKEEKKKKKASSMKNVAKEQPDFVDV